PGGERSEKMAAGSFVRSRGGTAGGRMDARAAGCGGSHRPSGAAEYSDPRRRGMDDGLFSEHPSGPDAREPASAERERRAALRFAGMAGVAGAVLYERCTVSRSGERSGEAVGWLRVRSASILRCTAVGRVLRFLIQPL